jgi:cytochrome oxidase Cu insertion factor (SCO1/SenC/PrrC family)
MRETARRWRVRAPAALALLLAGAGARATKDAERTGTPGGRIAPDPSRLPAPGSYMLPRILSAPDGQVLGPDGRPQRLHRLLAGRLTVLSFMYTYCRDPEGCPLAWRAMEQVHAALLRDPALAARAQLASLSFDPSNDTPRQMALYGGERVRDARVRWHFLTAASVARLLPLLDGFGQDVTVETDARGRPTRTLNHLLKIFLVDAMLQVREVYSVATLAPEAIVNDLRTLALERE